MDVSALLEKARAWVLSGGLQILLIVIMTLGALRAAKFLSARLLSAIQKSKEDLEFKKRTETLSSIFRYVLTIVIIVVAVIMIMGELGIEIGPIIAAAGIVGLAVGFGAQSLVKDVITGFFILLEDQIRVGDVIQIADKSGLVEKISLRTTVLRDLSGNVYYVPNGSIAVVTNMTKEFSRYVFDIGVAYREDIDEVMKIIKEVDQDLRNDPQYKNDILEPIEVLGLDEFADSAIIVKACTKTKPREQWRVKREFNRRLKKKFDERDIEIPFPHLTVYMGKDKEGHSPPLNVTIERNNG